MSPTEPRETHSAYDRSHTWRPDWATSKRSAIKAEITFDDPDMDCFFPVHVLEESKGCFRIYGRPFSDELYWGDLFEGERDGSGFIRFKGFLDRPPAPSFSTSDLVFC